MKKERIHREKGGKEKKFDERNGYGRKDNSEEKQVINGHMARIRSTK